jgi:hypothetical protein
VNTYPTLSLEEFAKRLEMPVDTLRKRLLKQRAEYLPDGYVLLQCVMLDSSLVGTHVCLPYGPRNTLKSPPTGPFSPRGLASDMSLVVGLLPTGALDSKLGLRDDLEDLQD